MSLSCSYRHSTIKMSNIALYKIFLVTSYSASFSVTMGRNSCFVSPGLKSAECDSFCEDSQEFTVFHQCVCVCHCSLCRRSGCLSCPGTQLHHCSLLSTGSPAVTTDWIFRLPRWSSCAGQGCQVLGFTLSMLLSDGVQWWG